MKHFTYAQTEKNLNSTRATVLLKLFIESNRIVGFRFQYYFLEKNRVVNHNKGESVFHALLFIARELPGDLKAKHHIAEDLSEYAILKNSLDVKSKHNNSKRYAAVLEDFKVGASDRRRSSLAKTTSTWCT